MSRRERAEQTDRMESVPLELRAADADRHSTVAVLQRHFVAGRLTDAELGERIKRALEAQTHGDLVAVVADLPAERSTATSARPHRRRRHGYRWSEDWGYSPHLRTYLGVMTLLVFIWLVTTPGGYFWPMWPALGWGIGVFAHGSASKCGVRRDDAPEPRVQMT